MGSSVYQEMSQSLNKAMLKFIRMDQESLKNLQVNSKKIVIERLTWEKVGDQLSNVLLNITPKSANEH